MLVRTRRELLDQLTRKDGRVFFVPTMGYFHEGHLSLIRHAAADRDKKGTVVVSLFVNPTQFNNPADLSNYPRDEGRDAKLAKQAGCDVLFVPDTKEIYPDGFGKMTISVPALSGRWEGEHRQGHFEGVATVVAKLFNIVMPDEVYFGEKDWQQCKVVEQMVEDLNFPLHLNFVSTVREPDGLAMSSRNALLRPEFRSKAAALFRVLRQAAESFVKGGEPRGIEKLSSDALISGGFSSVDYIAIVNADTLEPANKGEANCRVLGTATIGGVRLIDNVEAK